MYPIVPSSVKIRETRLPEGLHGSINSKWVRPNLDPEFKLYLPTARKQPRMERRGPQTDTQLPDILLPVILNCLL
jgi:hypothetical protein